MVSHLEGQTPHSESPTHRPAMTTRWPIVVVALLAVLSAACESTNDGHPKQYGFTVHVDGEVHQKSSGSIPSHLKKLGRAHPKQLHEVVFAVRQNGECSVKLWVCG